jgi:hypothetical protein
MVTETNIADCRENVIPDRHAGFRDQYQKGNNVTEHENIESGNRNSRLELPSKILGEF